MLSIEQIIEYIDQPKLSSPFRLYKGGLNYLCEIQTGDIDLMVKIYPSSRKYIAQSEEYMLRQLQEHNIPAPRVLEQGIVNGYGYLTYQKIPGYNLNFDAIPFHQQTKFNEELISVLMRMQQINSLHIGNITENEPAFSTWSSFLKENISNGLIHLADIDLVPSKTLITLKRYLGSHKKISDDFVMKAMTWGDLKSENILVHDNKLAAILDFESCFYGDPVLSIGYLFAKEGESNFFNQLSSQFEKIVSFKRDDIYFYSILRLLRISKYLKLPMPTGIKRQPILDYFPGIKIALTHIK